MRKRIPGSFLRGETSRARLYGVFHGVYVFIAVLRYWLAVYRANDTSSSDRKYIIDRLLRLPRQLALATGVLERHAHLTPLGREVFQQMLRDVADLQQQMRQVALPADSPALAIAEDGSYQPEKSKIDGRPLSAIGAVLEHVWRNDVHGQCAGLLDDFARTAS